MTKRRSIADQLRGAGQLAARATLGVTDLVEQMHRTIGGGPAVLGKPLEGVVKLVTAPTYGAIRGVTTVVAAGLDLALESLRPVLQQVGAERGPVLAALNGVLGDYLAATGNPLAMEMALCRGSDALDLRPEALAQAFPVGERLLVLVHGSSCDEGCWLRKGHHHGEALAAAHGLLPISLRYNSGLHVSQNGAAFASLLERLVSAWPRPIESIDLLAHSMGGLVSRSACLTAEAQGHAWRAKLRALVTLGTPHHGAPLERGGAWLESMLGVSRYSAPLVRLAQMRSAGVTDLRYGNVLPQDWEGQDRFAPGKDPRRITGLPEGVACFAIAATRDADQDGLTGDGLVPVASALGRHAVPERALPFPEANVWVLAGANHLDLLSSAAVCAKLVEWLG